MVVYNLHYSISYLYLNGHKLLSADGLEIRLTKKQQRQKNSMKMASEACAEVIGYKNQFHSTMESCNTKENEQMNR